jgi:hypothetical protein
VLINFKARGGSCFARRKYSWQKIRKKRDSRAVSLDKVSLGTAVKPDRKMTNPGSQAPSTARRAARPVSQVNPDNRAVKANTAVKPDKLTKPVKTRKRAAKTNSTTNRMIKTRISSVAPPSFRIFKSPGPRGRDFPYENHEITPTRFSLAESLSSGSFSDLAFRPRNLGTNSGTASTFDPSNPGRRAS